MLSGIHLDVETHSADVLVTARKIDLNLFRVFDAVMRLRSVTAAGQELGVTASAVSHALSRLRENLHDELFILGPAGMEATARAKEIALLIRQGLSQLELAVGGKPFDPLATARAFRIAASDFLTVATVPRLAARLAVAAPQVGLRIFPFNRVDAIRRIDNGQLDFAIGWFGELPERMRRTTLFVEHEALLVRAGHPLAQTASAHNPPTLDRLLSFRHVVVELTGVEEDAVDGFLDERGVLRRTWIERLLLEMGGAQDNGPGRVAVSAPHYAAVPPLLLATDYIATLPRSFALQVAASGDFVLLEPPYAPLSVDIELIWHQRSDSDSGAQWMIGEWRETFGARDGVT